MQPPISMSARPAATLGRVAIAALVVSALGYFVDIYDLILFSMVRVKSLRAIGVPDAELLNQGIRLINWQMGGMLLGGVVWGVLGDKRGRLSVLFGSILLYSLANIANAFVTGLGGYAFLRFVAGIGLAGELGAGITLVSETLPKHTRGMGTSFVAGFGILGAVAAYLVGESFPWSTAYIVGGVMGLVLLVLRIGVFESALFKKLTAPARERGNFFSLFARKDRAIKYVSVILIGLPIWFTVGILMTFSPEIGKALGMSEVPAAGRAVLFCYIGLAISDVASGLLSAALKSRKKTVFGFLGATTLAMSAYFFAGPQALSTFYGICMGLGVGCGYWAMFVTIAAEQFGTNLRATATTTVPNFVRGAVPLLTSAFQAGKPVFGVVRSAEVVGYATLAIAFVAAIMLEETYGKDLDYVE
jgi:putative MFS transporter